MIMPFDWRPLEWLRLLTLMGLSSAWFINEASQVFLHTSVQVVDPGFTGLASCQMAWLKMSEIFFKSWRNKKIHGLGLCQQQDPQSHNTLNKIILLVQISILAHCKFYLAIPHSSSREIFSLIARSIDEKNQAIFITVLQQVVVENCRSTVFHLVSKLCMFLVQQCHY